MKRLLFLISLLALPVLAALPPQSSEELAEQAQVVVEAQVMKVSSKVKLVGIGSFDREYTLTLRIIDVRKGSVGGVKEMNVLCKQTGRRPSGWAGPQGQNDIPDISTIGLFYLRKKGTGAFHLLEPNGWEPQPN